MPDNDVQFAVVREDPMVEAELVRLTNASNVLLIASGGCTALTLQALFPDLRITLVDFNPAQLERVREGKREHCRAWMQPYDIGDLILRPAIQADSISVETLSPCSEVYGSSSLIWSLMRQKYVCCLKRKVGSRMSRKLSFQASTGKWLSSCTLAIRF